MIALDAQAKIGVVGAGAMGAGIAQLAATHGHTVVLEDTDSTAILRATNATMKNLERLVEKGRVTDDEAKAIRDRIQLTVGDPSDPASLGMPSRGPPGADS